MTSVVVVDCTFKNVFLTFCALQVGPPKCCRTRGNLLLTLPLDGPECINNVVINAYKKINALR